MTVMPAAKAAASRNEPAYIADSSPPTVPPSSALDWLAAACLGTPTTWPISPADRLRSGLYVVASLFLLALFWQTVSYLIGADVLPGPIASMLAVEQSSREGYLWSDIGITAYRIAGAFLIAIAAALVIGVLLGRSRLAERLFGPWVTIGASIPSLVVIVIIYLSVGVNDHAAMIGTALIVAPPMIFAVWDGIRAINPELQEMARAFSIPQLTILRRVILPQTTPFIFTAARTGLSLTWRLMIFVELLGRSSGVGYRIQYFYNLVDMKRVVAAALPFIALMLLFEFSVLRPLERWAFRWRRAEAK
jgi:NitT/TauT family transport system permease protein